MNGEGRWSDARALVDGLTRRPTERRVLVQLVDLPLASARTMASLLGLADADRVYRCLTRLMADGLVDVVRPAFRPRGSPRLPYLTDLGLATAALLEDLELAEMVRRARLAREGLLARLPGLAPARAVRSLLAAVADSRPGRVRLVAWREPWLWRFRPPTAKGFVTIKLPAYAELSWGEKPPDACFLVPEPGTLRIRAYRQTIDWLIQLRHERGGSLPPLVVATPDDQRADEWLALLADRAEARRDAPLQACVARWRKIGAVLAEAQKRPELWPTDCRSLARRPPRRSACPSSDGRRLPVFVGGPLAEPRAPESRVERLGHLALNLTWVDLSILEKLGPHPFLSTARLAVWLKKGPREVRHLRKSLIERGLVRLLTADELAALRRPDGAAPLLTHERVAVHAAAELAELTVDGLVLLAAHWGLTFASAVGLHGLCGGGPETPVGPREHLLRFFEHTLASDGLFVEVIRTVQGPDALRHDGLLCWRNASTCRYHSMRPDGYALVRCRGQLYRFFGECDRGTMRERDLRPKFVAYHDAFAYELSLAQAGRLTEYPTFPTVLVVTIDEASEDTIAEVVKSVAVDDGYKGLPPLPLLLTCRSRLEDPGNPLGPFGPIWRDRTSAARRRPPPPER